jgi:hypothetical protein
MKEKEGTVEREERRGNEGRRAKVRVSDAV